MLLLDVAPNEFGILSTWEILCFEMMVWYNIKNIQEAKDNCIAPIFRYFPDFRSFDRSFQVVEGIQSSALSFLQLKS